MSNYTKATNFATKDTLPTGDSGKIVKGTEIDNEFNAIASAISSKADTASPTFTGTPAAPTATSGSNTTQIATTAYVKGEVDTAVAAIDADAVQTLTNKTIDLGDNTVTGTLAEFNTAVSDANLASLAGSETLTNKTIALGSNTVSGTKSQFNTAVTDTDFAFTNDFTGSNQSLGTNGYQKLPGGLIIQWGEVSVSPDGTATVTWNTAYPTACLQAVCTQGDAFGLSSDAGASIYNLSTTNATVRNGANNGGANSTLRWFSVGY
jgi:hypothetical protein